MAIPPPNNDLQRERREIAAAVREGSKLETAEPRDARSAIVASALPRSEQERRAYTGIRKGK